MALRTKRLWSVVVLPGSSSPTFTVPPDKRWIIRSYRVVNQDPPAAATWNVILVPNGGSNMTLDGAFDSPSTIVRVRTNYEVLNEGDGILMFNASATMRLGFFGFGAELQVT